MPDIKLPDGKKIPFSKKIDGFEISKKISKTLEKSALIMKVNGELKTNKTLTVSVLDPIEPGMNSVEFINMLQKNIYEEIDKIV